MKIRFISIATRYYLDYWLGLIESAAKVNIFDDSRISFALLTDQKDRTVEELAKRSLNSDRFQIFEIPPLGWPDATMKRFELMLSHLTFEEDSVDIYIDADMTFDLNPIQTILDSLSLDSMTFVLHPGYFRPTGFLSRSYLYLAKPLMAIDDLKTFVRQGAIGTWERRPVSKAYVPRSLRSKYFCGALWFGAGPIFQSFLRYANESYVADRELGIVPVWHDESYLNQYAATHNVKDAEPSLCFFRGSFQLRKMPSIIRALVKTESKS